MILGHEMAGEIVELGEDVSEVEGWTGSCHLSHYGVRLLPLLHSRQAQPVPEPPKRWGTTATAGWRNTCLSHQQLVSLGHLLKLPKGLPWEIACQVEPFACALYSMLVCGIGPGTSLTIVGAGPMGLTHLLIARSMGCGANNRR